ncbi:hypothetical protein CCY99_03810 [Helicobacter sp. 16-1353]|uniref:MlaD family protein n=1 Tax=Helicobacter sp. 16-1353 TaxID=2004996 RepID=UPI000DCDF73F|nr:MlaD family protein [Helicobacter sp. 16-1353]RAX54484.1 hypothetical protein CCY99_03810 [Helicobacter sp. 16-1353]
MERGINFILIGACFIACMFGLVVFILWFSDSNDLGSIPKTYKAYSKNAIDGIRIDSDIKYKGINVGKVKNINFKDNNFDEIIFELSIRSDLPIKKDSTLKVAQSGLLGRNYLELIQNNKNDEIINKDAILQIETSSMDKIMESVPNLANKVDSLLSNANNMLNEENANNIAKILVSIKDSADNLNKIILSLQKNTDDVESLIQNVNKVSIDADEMLNILTSKIKNGEYDLKTTLAPALISIEQSMNSINSLAKEGSTLLDSLKENPYNTIFGYRNEDKK